MTTADLRVCVCVNSEFEVFCPLRALSKNKDGKSFILQSTKLSKKKTTQQHECVLCCGDTRSPTHTHGLFQSVKASVQVFAHACSGCNGGDSSDDYSRSHISWRHQDTHTHELSKPPRRQHLASSLHSLGQWPLTLGTT